MRSFLRGPCGQERETTSVGCQQPSLLLALKQTCSQRVNREPPQGGTTPLPTGGHYGTGMEPEFTLEAEPGYEQCWRLQRTNTTKQSSWWCICIRNVTMNAFFSSMVWKRPWPNFEVVSMNFRSIFSRARRLVCTSRDWRKDETVSYSTKCVQEEVTQEV